MSKGTILLTGATGFIGFHILLTALQHNYSVRIVVRNESKASTLKQNPALLALKKQSSYSFVVVPDLTLIGSLDAAADGADYIIHTASPLPFQAIEPEKQWDEVVAPAINCTVSALESAKKSSSVRRVVVTSSCAAFLTPELLLGPDPAEPVVLSEADRNAEISPPFPHVLVAYLASKTAALERSEAWMRENAPRFDLVSLAPTYVVGKNQLARSSTELFSGSNMLFLRMVAGLTPPDSPAEVAATVHIDDAALLHVMALDREKIAGGQTFLFSQEVVWNDVVEITGKKFPDAVSSGLLPNTGNVPSKKVSFRIDKTEKAFGLKLKSVEQMVESLVGQYVEFLEEERKTSNTSQ